MMDRRIRILTVALGAAALPLLAAEAAAQAPTQTEVYQLAQVGGQALPAVLEQDDDGCRDEVVSGTLTLEADGRWTLVTREREVCGDDVDDDEDREEGRYTVQGQTITFLDDDGEPEDMDTGDDSRRPDLEDLTTGTRSGNTLTVRLDDGRTDLVFRR